KMARMSRPQTPSGEPKDRWSAGDIALLGGYPVSPGLAVELDDFDATRVPRADRAFLFDLRLPAGEAERIEPSESVRRRAADWSGQGVPTAAVAVPGAAFWNVADLVDVPPLIEATMRAVEVTLQTGSDEQR